MSRSTRKSLNGGAFAIVESLGFARVSSFHRDAERIHMGLPQGERLTRLNAIAIRQMQVLTGAVAIKQLKG